MTTHRIAFVGAGARAYAHADAYQHIPNAHLVGCFDPHVERREAFARAFGARPFHSLKEMLEATEPDMVHISTPPNTRVDVMRGVSECGISACTVEKPIALGVRDWRALTQLSQTTQTKFAVCHQFRWHPLLVKCRNALASGELGHLRFLESSARLTIADQGTHTLHYANYLNGDSPIRTVFGCASGWTPDSRHAGPENSLALVAFENGTRLLWNVGPMAPAAGDPSTIWQHVRLAAYADGGHVTWEEFGGWEVVSLKEGVNSGRVDLEECAHNNRIAQAAFQSEMLRWIEDPSILVGTNLNRSLHEWKAVLALYESTLAHRPVDLDTFQPSDDLEERLNATLTR